jgi:hypothetical protein
MADRGPLSGVIVSMYQSLTQSVPVIVADGSLRMPGRSRSGCGRESGSGTNQFTTLAAGGAGSRRRRNNMTYHVLDLVDCLAIVPTLTKGDHHGSAFREDEPNDKDCAVR